MFDDNKGLCGSTLTVCSGDGRPENGGTRVYIDGGGGPRRSGTNIAVLGPDADSGLGSDAGAPVGGALRQRRRGLSRLSHRTRSHWPARRVGPGHRHWSSNGTGPGGDCQSGLGGCSVALSEGEHAAVGTRSSLRGARSFPNSRSGPSPHRKIFRFAIALSAACQWACWSSRPPNTAVRVSPRAAPSSRIARSSRFPANVTNKNS
jgi:hypothetical protein